MWYVRPKLKHAFDAIPIPIINTFQLQSNILKIKHEFDRRVLDNFFYRHWPKFIPHRFMQFKFKMCASFLYEFCEVIEVLIVIDRVIINSSPFLLFELFYLLLVCIQSIFAKVIDKIRLQTIVLSGLVGLNNDLHFWWDQRHHARLYPLHIILYHFFRFVIHFFFQLYHTFLQLLIKLFLDIDFNDNDIFLNSLIKLFFKILNFDLY